MDIQDTKDLVILQCKRVIEILESDNDLKGYSGRVRSELKVKMHELRRDTLRLENQVYRPWEYEKGERI